jgi:hypothetical protein
MIQRSQKVVRSHVRWFLAFSTLLLLNITSASPPTGGGWFGSNKDNERTKWGSMLEVDPTKIISIMMKHGGLLIPESSMGELKVLAKVCNAEKARLNVMERELELTNFVVRLPGEEPALRIGRVYLRWDSYLTPCVDVEVDDVFLLIEFLTVLLTETNWCVDVADHSTEVGCVNHCDRVLTMMYAGMN